MPYRKARERRLPPGDDVFRNEEADPRRFFGEAGRSRRVDWKTRQLCRQVERAAGVTLATECEAEVLLGAVVAAVEPAPDARRLRVTVVLGPGRGVEDLEPGRTALAGGTAAFREEVARSVHRKRVPEIVFDVVLSPEVDRE